MHLVAAMDAVEALPLAAEVVEEQQLEGHCAAAVCFCCLSPVEDGANAVSEMVLQQSGGCVLDILQELLVLPQVPASARLCPSCLQKVCSYSQLMAAVTELCADVRATFARTTALQADAEASEAELGATAPELHQDGKPARRQRKLVKPIRQLQHDGEPPPPEQLAGDGELSFGDRQDGRSAPDGTPADVKPAPGDGQEHEGAPLLQSRAAASGDHQPVLNISIKVLDSDHRTPAAESGGAAAARFACAEPGCGRSFGSARCLRQHCDSRHRPAGPSCPECRLVAASADQLRLHVEAVHKTGEAVYGCDECPERFHLESELKQHRRTQHDVKRHIKCRHCRRVFRSRLSYLEHLAQHSGQRLLECPVCSEKFNRRVCLSVHMKVHRKHGLVHTCDLCSEKLSTLGRLRTHQQRVHGIARPWRCKAEGCDKAFRSCAALQVHSVNHTGDRKFACDACPKSFSTKHRLTSHYRIHTGERPFQCDLCGRQFTHKSNLHQHNAQAHTTERSHKCGSCGKAFRRVREMEAHVASAHTGGGGGGGREGRATSHATSGGVPRTARVTGATADTATGSVTGTVTATSTAGTATGTATSTSTGTGKQYKCSVCQRAFRRLDNLRTHMFIHSDKKPFECRVCGLGFLRWLSLLRHVQHYGHGTGTGTDYVINEAVFVVDASTAEDREDSVRLITGGQHKVYSVLDTPVEGVDAPVQTVPQIIFKTDSPRAEMDSPDDNQPDVRADNRWQQ